MLKKIIQTFGSSLLFYSDKDGNAVFRNYCLFKNTGSAYKIELTKSEVGKILEYRLELDKYLNTAYLLIPFFVYFLFIHMKYSLLNVLLCEFLWIILASYARLRASSSYSKLLNKNFGEYKLVEFAPPLTSQKEKENISNFHSKILLTFISIILFFIPAFLLQTGMKLTLRAKKPHLKIADGISKLYTSFYPKTSHIYDMKAYIKYKNGDLKGALSDYKTALEISGKNFEKKDFIRLGNLLYLEKQLKTPTIALDNFNDYATRKKMSTLEESKILWIKSIFSIENNIETTIIQDYDDMILSLGNDENNKFYITSDKAYMLYLMNEYTQAIKLYDSLISYAKANQRPELKSLYAERGFAKQKIGDNTGAKQDFIDSEIPLDEINSYEPSFITQKFIIEDF